MNISCLNDDLHEARVSIYDAMISEGYGRINSFSYLGAQVDPRPQVLALGYWKHPNTHNRLMGGINLNYLDDQQITMLRQALPDILKPRNLRSRYWTGQRLLPQIFGNYYRTYDTKKVKAIEPSTLRFLKRASTAEPAATPSAATPIVSPTTPELATTAPRPTTTKSAEVAQTTATTNNRQSNLPLIATDKPSLQRPQSSPDETIPLDDPTPSPQDDEDVNRERTSLDQPSESFTLLSSGMLLWESTRAYRFWHNIKNVDSAVSYLGSTVWRLLDHSKPVSFVFKPSTSELLVDCVDSPESILFESGWSYQEVVRGIVIDGRYRFLDHITENHLQKFNHQLLILSN